MSLLLEITLYISLVIIAIDWYIYCIIITCMLLQFLLNGIFDGCGYAIIALGLGLIYKSTRILHIAYGAIFVLALYVFYFSNIVLSVPYTISILLTLIVSVIVGITIELFVYRPLYNRKATPDVFIIASLGIYMVMINILAIAFSNEIRMITDWSEQPYNVGSLVIGRIQMIQVVVFLIVVGAFMYVLRRSMIGKKIQAMSDDPELCTVIGIETKRIRLLVFAIGSLLVGIGACLFVSNKAFSPHVGMNILFVSMAAVIIGGIDVFEGAIIGALSIAILQNIVIWKFATRWEEAIVFILLIAFLILRPQGILGKKKRVEEQ